ncbi:hypothetical protein LTR12_014774 [Friedmanniomyces endolithicus]|nr:hypothetical protein LTR12_014774 [Friedmanniomyces endolithicus]
MQRVLVTAIDQKQRSEEIEAVERRRRASDLARGEFIAEEVLRDLAALKAECAGHDETVRDPAAKWEVSPWLERTRWPRCLEDYRPADAAPLMRLPDPITEPVLIRLTQSRDRLVKD